MAKDRFLCFSVLCLISLMAEGAQVYVTDQMQVTMRKGQSTSHGIMRMLKSGTPMELLADDDGSGYAKVKLGDGTVGWVLSRFLDKIPSARDRLTRVNKKLVSLEEENKTLKEQLASLTSENKDVSTKQSALQKRAISLDKELEKIKRTAANALSLDSENQSLKKQVMELDREHQVLTQQNATLKDRQFQSAFIAGAVVLSVGIALGLILPRLKFKKRSNWESYSGF